MRTRQFWFVTFPGSELLDVSGPWSVLGYANEVIGRQEYEPKLVSPVAGSIQTRHAMTLSCAQAVVEAAKRGLPHTLVIAGATPANGRSDGELRVARWLRSKGQSIPRLASVCTGAFVLGEAGLLDGRRATTHWLYRDELKGRFPRARLDRDDLFVRDGRVWTSAGVTAGIDLMLAMVEEDHGHAVALTVAKCLVLYLRRVGTQAVFKQDMGIDRRSEGARGLATLIQGHIATSLTVSKLATLAGLSERTLSRVCKRELGEAPSALVRRMRLEHAQRLLDHTSLPLKAVAMRSGLGDSATLWRVFKRRLGMTPAEYRRRFTVESAGKPKRKAGSNRQRRLPVGGRSKG